MEVVTSHPPDPEAERPPPIEISLGYTNHDAHGYRHGFGACMCTACQAIHNRAAKDRFGPLAAVPNQRDIERGEELARERGWL